MCPLEALGVCARSLPCVLRPTECLHTLHPPSSSFPVRAPRSSVLLPPSTYPLLEALPRELVEKGTLSSLQLEGALYAATKHQQILPSGQSEYQWKPSAALYRPPMQRQGPPGPQSRGQHPP